MNRLFVMRSEIFRTISNVLEYRVLPWLLERRIMQVAISSLFHRLYYYHSGQTWRNSYWLNTQVFKIPFDMWIYQEIIVSLKPDVIIETGTAYGGSALFFATILDALGNGRVITVDIVKHKVPRHKRIQYIHGSSVSSRVLRKMKMLIHKKDTVLVILDSKHTFGHVLQELYAYHHFVSKNSYLVVEDTHLFGHPVMPNFPNHGGPMEAVKDFISGHPEFSADRSREKFFFTFFPGGFLKKSI